MTNKNALRSVLVFAIVTISVPAPAEIVVTGGRIMRDHTEVAVPIDMISLEDIQSVGITRVDDLIRGSTPQSSDNPAGLNPGFTTIRGFVPDRTLVLLNGTRAPDSSFVLSFPALFIDRVEVLRTPQGAMYGAGATSGIVNVVTSDGIAPVGAGTANPLNTAQTLLGNTQISVHNNAQCNTTNGVFAPPFAFFPNYSFSRQDMGDIGGVYGWTLDNPVVIDPAAADQQEGVADAVETGPTYTQFKALEQRIANEPNLTEWQRGLLQARLILGGTMAPEFFSDAAVEAGLFDPTRVYQGLLAGTTASPGTGESPGNVTWGEGEVAPFDKYPYPQARYFDFSLCTDEQRDQVLTLIARRNWHRGERSEITGQLLDGPVSDETYNEIMSAAYAQDDARDEYNRALKALWISCVEPDPATDQQTAAEASDPAAATAETAAVDSTASNQAGGATTYNPMDDIIVTGIYGGRADDARDATGPQTESDDDISYWTGRWHPWSLDLRIYQYRDDDSGIKEGIPELAIGINPDPFDARFGVAFTYSGYRDTETGHDQSPQKGFTNANGEISFRSLMTGANIRQSRPDADASGTTSPEEQLEQFYRTMTTGDFPQIPAGPLGLAFGYEHRDEDYGFTSYSASSTGSGVDFQDLDLAIDYSTRNGGPRIRAQFPFAEADAIYQVFTGKGNVWDSFADAPEGTQDPIPSGFGLGVGFPLGEHFVQTYRFNENLDLGLHWLNDMEGQGGWGNDFCGQEALPPEGVGYVAAEMSPIKSVDDRWALANVGLDEALVSEDAGPVIVGIIDTGLDWNHLDFAWDNLWRNEDEIPDNGIDDDNNGYVDDIIGWNFMAENNSPWDNDGHGTFVTGLVAAARNNDVGIDGANPNAKIMVLKALNNHGRTRASYIARAIVYGADNGARILNLSVSGPGFPRIVQDAVDYAVSKGVLIVTAAGNRAANVDRAKPARLRRVMTVAATGPDEKRAAFSNVGSALNIAAPGVDVVSLRARATDMMYNSAETSYVPGDAYIGDDNRYYRATGTSFASAIVTGVASVVLAERPELTLAELRRVLEQSARDVETPGRDRLTGYGIVDVGAALQADPAFYIHADIPEVRRLDADGQSFLQVVGVADANQFARATLDIGQGEDPAAWTGTGPVLLERLRLGELGRIPAAELEGADTWTVRLTVEHANGRKREARYVVDLR